MKEFWTGVILFFVIICSLWLQLNLFNIVPLFGIKANIGIVLVVALSILCGLRIGISVGIVYGLLLDCLLEKSVGIFTLLFFLVGFFCGKASNRFSKENKTSIILITAGTTIIFEILSYMFFVVNYKYDIDIFHIIKTIIIEVIYNVIISMLCFRAFTWLADGLNRENKSYY